MTDREPTIKTGNFADVRFLAAIDLTSNRGQRLPYWQERLSTAEGCAQTFVARVGGLYAGYLALMESGPDIAVGPKFVNTDLSAMLMKYAGVDKQLVQPA